VHGTDGSNGKGRGELRRDRLVFAIFVMSKPARLEKAQAAAVVRLLVPGQQLGGVAEVGERRLRVGPDKPSPRRRRAYAFSPSVATARVLTGARPQRWSRSARTTATVPPMHSASRK